MSHEWQSIFFNQTFNSRVPHTNFVDNSNFKIDKNLIENRLTLLIGKITFEMLNLEYPTFKIKCKEMFTKNYDLNLI